VLERISKAATEQSAEDIGLRDTFSKQRLAEGRYSALVIDRDWTEEIEQDFRRWRAERR
jgi:hypothetical protein